MASPPASLIQSDKRLTKEGSRNIQRSFLAGDKIMHIYFILLKVHVWISFEKVACQFLVMAYYQGIREWFKITTLVSSRFAPEILWFTADFFKL